MISKYAGGPQVVSITAIQPLNLFSWYPISSLNNVCDIKLKVLLENSIGESPPGSLQVDTTLITVSNFSENQFILSLSILFGEFQSLINVSSSNGITFFNLNLICKEIDFNKTKPQIIGDKPGFNEIEHFHSYLKIDGFDGVRPQTFLTDKTIGNIKPVGNSNLYIINWCPDYIPDHIQGEWSIEISDSFGVKSFKTNSFYYDVQVPPNNIQDTVYLPSDIISIINEFGFGFGPLYFGKVISNSNRPFLVISNGDLSYYGTPIRGKKGNMDFISSFIENEPFNGVNSSLFNLYSPAGQYSIQIKMVSLIIQKYQPTPLQNTLGNSIVSNIFGLHMLAKNYKLNDYVYTLNQNHIIKGFPFGFVSGNNSDFKIEVSSYQSIIQNTDFLIKSRSITFSDEYNITIPLNMGDSNPPKLTNFEIIQLSQIKYLLKLHITSKNGLFQINSFPNSYSIEKIGLESLVNGNIYEGDYEIILSTGSIHKIQLIDILKNKIQYDNFDIISLNPILQFTSPFISKEFSLEDFNNISFAINDLNILNNTGYNIMYIKSKTLEKDVPMSLMLLDPVSISINKSIRYPIVYNDERESFECKFIIPSNNIFGEIPYVIFYSITGKIYNSLLSSSAQLRINETYLDNQGPIFKEFQQFGRDVTVVGPSLIGWTLKISDDYNGFKNGYIKIMGSNDNSIYHFNFTVDNLMFGDKWDGVYVVSISIDETCISQEFVITHVSLFDENGIPSIYNIFSENQKSISSPFINFYNGGINSTRLPITCSYIYPTTISKPTLQDLKLSTQTIDVGKLMDRSVTISAKLVLSNESYFNFNQTPTFYLTSPTMDIIECQTMVQVVVDGVRFICEIEIPVGFGYPGPIIISLYGVLYKNGYFAGYSSSDILLFGNNKHYLNTTLSLNDPIITSHDDVYSFGGKIWLYGFGFTQNQTVYIKYMNRASNNNTFEEIKSICYAKSLTIKIKETTQPFSIEIISSQGIRSNEYLITPIIFISPPLPPINTTTPIPTLPPINTTAPIPTNSPQQCIGNPQCGGPKQGYCSSNGCICYSPWIGTSCQSKIVIVPPPKLNENDPSTNITKPKNDSSSGDNSSFTALISIVSLRELDFNNNIIKTFYFDKWIQWRLNDHQYLYMTNLETFYKNGTKLNCTTTVITEWFNSTTNITFANQQLTMNPSSLKYNINITKFPFENPLNTLQLTIQAKAFSEESDQQSCSSQDFGDTVTDNSNYIQLSVNDNSLYGRFIKRAIVDGNLNSINNIILGDQIDDNTYYSSESHIAISIPYYKYLIQLDPDFGILLDSESASSICKDNSIKKRLSNGAIIGIVVGCVGGAILVTIAILLAKKYKYHLRNIKPLKLKKMNN
ncbi:hypothetical protein ACTA71_005566 [Dictyostelium dimigraforme]